MSGSFKMKGLLWDFIKSKKGDKKKKPLVTAKMLKAQDTRIKKLKK